MLVDLGVGPGDRVAGYLPNCPEALVAFLAAAGLGAIWTSCALEFGPRSVVDRFDQVEPVVLLVAGGYRYGRKDVDRRAEVGEVVAGLPSVRHVLDIEYGDWRVGTPRPGRGLLASVTDAIHETTPVAVRPPAGRAVLLGHDREAQGDRPRTRRDRRSSTSRTTRCRWDLGRGDVMLWYSTTAWMMWNALVSGAAGRGDDRDDRRRPGVP